MWPPKARQTRQDKTREDKRSEDKTRQDKTRQDRLEPDRTRGRQRQGIQVAAHAQANVRVDMALVLQVAAHAQANGRVDMALVFSLQKKASPTPGPSQTQQHPVPASASLEPRASVARDQGMDTLWIHARHIREAHGSRRTGVGAGTGGGPLGSETVHDRASVPWQTRPHTPSRC
jgi:hypothetical protein